MASVKNSSESNGTNRYTLEALALQFFGYCDERPVLSGLFRANCCTRFKHMTRQLSLIRALDHSDLESLLDDGQYWMVRYLQEARHVPVSMIDWVARVRRELWLAPVVWNPTPSEPPNPLPEPTPGLQWVQIPIDM